MLSVKLLCIRICLSAAAAKSLQSCPTLRPHRPQPTRLPHPWDSPGKNTGVGCHFFLQCMKVKSESEVAQSCPTLRDPMDCMQPTRLLRPWDFPGESTAVGSIAFSVSLSEEELKVAVTLSSRAGFDLLYSGCF